MTLSILNSVPRLRNTPVLTISLLIVAFLFISGCSSSSDSKPKDTAKKIDRIELAASERELAVDTSLQLLLTGFYEDGDRSDLATLVSWTTSDSSIATISAEGIVTAIGNGTVTITANYGNYSEEIVLTVNESSLESLSISPISTAIIPGQSIKLSATGLFSDGTKQYLNDSVTWSVDDSSIATVSGNILTGIKKGQVKITASKGALSDSISVAVNEPSLISITLDYPLSQFVVGQSLTLKATGIFNDGNDYEVTNSVQWTVDNATVASVSNKELMFVSEGTVTVTAKTGSLTTSQTFTVVEKSFNRIEIAATTTKIRAGETTQLQAYGFLDNGDRVAITDTVQWASSSSNAAVSNGQGLQGLVTAITQGTTNITATLSGTVGAVSLTILDAQLESIEISPREFSLAVGRTMSFTATGIYSDKSTRDITQHVQWLTSNSSIASIDNSKTLSGMALGLSTGTTQISAKLGTISATATLTVTSAALVNLHIEQGATTLLPGNIMQLRAVGVFDDGTTQDLTKEATWFSSNYTIANVSNKIESIGLVKALTVGSTSISAVINDTLATVAITVADKIISSVRLEAIETQLALGTRTSVRAIAHFNDNSSQDISDNVTFVSSDTTGLAVSNNTDDQGTVIAQQVGNYTVSILTDASYPINDVTITVTEASLNKIAITPEGKSIGENAYVQLSATGFYSDNTHQDITQLVTWQSSNTNLAVVSNETSTAGIAFGIAQGNVTVTASLSSISATTSLEVAAASLVSLNITALDNTSSVPVGFSKQLSVSGLYDNGDTIDLSTQAHWYITDANYCRLNDSLSSDRVVVGKAKGSCQVTASYDGKSTTFNFEVTDATLTSMSISPTNLTLAKGLQASLRVTGTYSDGSEKDITADVIFQSDSNAVSINSANATLTAVNEGDATVSVAHSGQSSTSTITVTSATLTSITLQSNTTTYYKGRKALIKAIGNFSDSSTQDISGQTVWSVNDNSIASVNSNNIGALSLLAGGTVTLTASLNNVSQDLSITVIDEPDIAVDVTITATPNMILNNGTEESTLAINLIPADSDSGIIADGTDVTVTVYASDNSIVDTQTLQTTSGSVNYAFSTVNKGSYVITAKIPDTNITAVINLFATDDFSEMIARSRSFPASITSDGKITSGSVLGFSVINLSNRAYTISGFVVFNDGVAVYDSTKDTPLDLADMELSAGEKLNIAYTITEDSANAFSAALYLTDKIHGTSIEAGKIIIGQSYVLSVQ